MNNMYDTSIPACIQEKIDRDYEAREADKRNTKRDIEQTLESIKSYLPYAESLGLLKRTVRELHETEDTLRVIVNTDLSDPSDDGVTDTWNEDTNYGAF